jgi:hypothetical protein
MNTEQYIEAENIRAFGVYNNYQSRLKSATITEEDRDNYCDAQTFINNL